MSYIYFSPAKLNLFLRVIGKREDGYHDIASLFQAVDFGDTLTFRFSDKDLFTTNISGIPHDKDNLVMRALALFRSISNINTPIAIQLDKKIPPGAGLGGGSSNAATTLFALNELFGYGATIETLMDWGSQLGSDLPFFFSSGRAYCTGRGDKVACLPKAMQEVQIYLPNIHLSTSLMYQKLDLKNLGKPLPEKCLEQDVDFNDFEEAAFSMSSELYELKQALLQAGYKRVCLTGSGAALFCYGPKKPFFKGGVSHFSARFLHRNLFSWYKPNCLCDYSKTNTSLLQGALDSLGQPSSNI